MSASNQYSDTGLQSALELYGDFLRRPSARAPGAFDALCEKHPALAEHLRRLHHIGGLAQSLAGSAPFHHSLREVFGEEVEVRLTLDEAEAASEENKATLVASFGVPPSGGPVCQPAEAGTPNRSDRYALQGEVARGGMAIIY